MTRRALAMLQAVRVLSGDAVEDLEGHALRVGDVGRVDRAGEELRQVARADPHAQVAVERQRVVAALVDERGDRQVARRADPDLDDLQPAAELPAA